MKLREHYWWESCLVGPGLEPAARLWERPDDWQPDGPPERVEPKEEEGDGLDDYSGGSGGMR